MSPRKVLSLVSLLSMLAIACGDEMFTEDNPAYRKYEKADAHPPEWRAVCQWKTPCPEESANKTDAGASDTK